MQLSECFTVYMKPAPVSVLLDEGLSSVPRGGAELEEGLGSIRLQAREESAVPIKAHGEELGTPLGRRCQPSHPWVTQRRAD